MNVNGDTARRFVWAINHSCMIHMHFFGGEEYLSLTKSPGGMTYTAKLDDGKPLLTIEGHWDDTKNGEHDLSGVYKANLTSERSGTRFVTLWGCTNYTFVNSYPARLEGHPLKRGKTMTAWDYLARFGYPLDVCPKKARRDNSKTAL